MYSRGLSQLPKNVAQVNNLLGGATAYERVRSNPLLMVLSIIVLLVLIGLIIYGIWAAMYAKEKKEAANCTPAHGCLLLKRVKNGNDKLQISSDRIPTQSANSSYSLSVWLYVKDTNFDGAKKWSNIMFRGGEEGDNGDDEAVQPGIWLDGSTNRLLFRWQTLGQKHSKPCCKAMREGCTKADQGKRCHNDDGTLKFCDGQGNWVPQDTDDGRHFSANPYTNPPNPACTGINVRGRLVDNTMARNTENEACVSNIPVNRWFLVTTVMHSQSVEIYIDGKIVVTQTLNSAPITHSDAPFNLCTDVQPGYGVNGFYGAITQLRYFAVPLTPYDVLKIYSWGPHPWDVENPDKLKKELGNVTGDVHASVSWQAQDQDSQGVSYGF